MFEGEVIEEFEGFAVVLVVMSVKRQGERMKIVCAFLRRGSNGKKVAESKEEGEEKGIKRAKEQEEFGEGGRKRDKVAKRKEREKRQQI